MRLVQSLIVALAVVVSAASSTARAQQLEKPAVQLAVGGKTLIAYLPLTIAERRGYFEKEGLKVEISDFAGGAKALQAVVGGSADILAGPYRPLFMANKGVALKAIALQAKSFGLVVGVGREKAASYQSLRDLKGMKIGVTAPGSASAIGLRMLLSKVGLTDERYLDHRHWRWRVVRCRAQIQ